MKSTQYTRAGGCRIHLNLQLLGTGWVVFVGIHGQMWQVEMPASQLEVAPRWVSVWVGEDLTAFRFEGLASFPFITSPQRLGR
jgi:hypothetical protein